MGRLKAYSFSEQMQDELEPILNMIDEGGPAPTYNPAIYPYWTYNGYPWNPPVDFTPKDYYGFVYTIINAVTGKKYIGKKFFWRSKILPITKTRKRRKRLKIESDWRDYFGSNKHLQKDVIELGVNSFYRQMLHLCKTKGECAYLEAKEQFENDVLLREDYYNGIISCRIGFQSVKNLK